MADTQIIPETRAIELSTEAFNAFCEDISGMFNVDMKCIPQNACIETIDNLKKRFKKLSAVNIVKTEGILQGSFYLIFDQGGLFTLSGVVVMLPENRILEEIKRGTIKDVESMNDAVREIGNLCVGSWDRIFREQFEGHGHFVQNGTFIGSPWDKPEDSIGLGKNESLSFVPFEMTVGKFPSFTCGVIFPKSVFDAKAKPVSDEKPLTENKADDKNVAADSNNVQEESVKQTEEVTKNDNSESEPVEKKKRTKTKIKSTSISNPDTQSEISVSETIKRITQSPAILPGQVNHNDLSISAAEIMDKNVAWCGSNASVQQAIEKMQLHDTGYLMVGNENVPEGIISRSDITGAVSPYLRPIFAKWRRPLDDATMNIRIKWIMTRPVHTVKPDTSLTKIIENMCKLGIRCLPVMNENNKVEGIVTVFNIFRILNNNQDIATVGNTLQVPLLV
jgi:CBS domain-containing protein